MRTAAFRLALVVAVVVVGAYLFDRAWDYSTDLGESLLQGEVLTPEGVSATVDAVDAQTITLRTDDDAFRRPGRFSVEWATGKATLGDVTLETSATVTREYQGAPPEPGTQVALSRVVYDSDPRSAHGIAYDTVDVPTGLGDFPAWHVDGGTTWVVFVHGQDSGREFALPVLPAVNEAGMSALVISYRNDPDAVPDPSGFHRFGQTEWRDLQDAVRYIIRRGGQDIILVGQGVGGSIVMAFQEQSALAERTIGLVLDSPILDLSETIDYVETEIPPGFRGVAKQLAAFRFDIRWAQLDYLRGAPSLDVPVLLFHGTEDETVPLATSEQLDELLEDLVIYRPVAGAGHGESWNVAPDDYEDAFGEFLRFVTRRASSSG